MIPNDEYEADFKEALTGLREDLYKHQTTVYRKIESDVISAWKEVQRIQATVIAEIGKSIPRLV